MSAARQQIIDRSRVSVAFHHVDMMQIVHNVQYLKWFEQGRLRLLERFISVQWAVENGLAVPVVQNRCEYLSPAYLWDELVLTTRHTLQDRWTGRFSFEHSISNQKTKVELCRGGSDVTVTDMRGRHVLKTIPPEVWARYDALKTAG